MQGEHQAQILLHYTLINVGILLFITFIYDFQSWIFSSRWRLKAWFWYCYLDFTWKFNLPGLLTPLRTMTINVTSKLRKTEFIESKEKWTVKCISFISQASLHQWQWIFHLSICIETFCEIQARTKFGVLKYSHSWSYGKKSS